MPDVAGMFRTSVAVEEEANARPHARIDRRSSSVANMLHFGALCSNIAPEAEWSPFGLIVLWLW